MSTAALELIQSIADHLDSRPTELTQIMHALEDGEALLKLGITDIQQEVVEEAHAIVCKWIDAVYDIYEDVPLD